MGRGRQVFRFAWKPGGPAWREARVGSRVFSRCLAKPLALTIEVRLKDVHMPRVGFSFFFFFFSFQQ